MKRLIKEMLWIFAGVFSAAFALKSFLLPNQFIDGGATGISLLISETTVLDISYVILAVNIPFIIVGYLQMSRRFVLKTVISVLILSLVLAIIDFPIVTDDLLLAAVFGGFFLGAGIGLSVRGGCVIDGTEILALYFSRKFNLSMGDIIIMINSVIFITAALLLGVEVALYSMLAYFVASKTMDFIIQGIEEYLGIIIISKKYNTIREAIIHEMNTGVTMFTGGGGYGKQGTPDQSQILYTVVTRLEMLKINRIVEDVDPNAFVSIHGVRDVRGGMLKRRVLTH